MPVRRAKKFEFKLGKFGFILFSFGIAVLILLSFIGGVIVGKHIESYPEKIARSFPGAMKDTIVETTDSMMRKAKGAKAAATAEKERIKLSFYDTLPKKEEDIGPDRFEKKEPSAQVKLPSAGTEVMEPAAPPPDARALETADTYSIQVASYKDKKKTEPLRAELARLGLTPNVEAANLGSQGIWYRVTLPGYKTEEEAKRTASLIEKKMPYIKCLIVHNKA